MTDTIDFANIFPQIQLSKGNHKTPAEGVCFYEAVAFFAGEPHSDRPKCACPALTNYGITLNDNMPDDIRNKLLVPLIGQVAGTRDTDSRIKRGEFLVMWTVNKTLPMALRAVGLHQHAARCESARTLTFADFAVLSMESDLSVISRWGGAVLVYAASCASVAAKLGCEIQAALSAIQVAKINPDVWDVAVEGLRQAVLIGRHDGFATNPASKVDDFTKTVNNKKVPA